MGFPWEGAKCYAEGGMVELKSFLRSKDTQCDQVAIPLFFLLWPENCPPSWLEGTMKQ